MKDLIDSIASWRSFIFVIFGFGFAPGFILRILVKIYPKEDPRRRELIAELYGVKHVERPLFVAQQVETVMLEGLPLRVKSAGSSYFKELRGLSKSNKMIRTGGTFMAIWGTVAGIAVIAITVQGGVFDPVFSKLGTYIFGVGYMGSTLLTNKLSKALVKRRIWRERQATLHAGESSG